VLHAAGEGHLLEGADEMPVLAAHLLVADDLDLGRVAAAQPLFVGQADELDRHRVQAHELGGHGVDGHLVVRGQEDVLDIGNHAARAGAIAGEGAIHDRKDAAVDVLLDQQQVHQRLVDDRVRPVTTFVEQAAKGVFHRARGSREDMRLHRGQVNDVLADEPFGNVESTRIDIVEHQELVGQISDRVAHIDPLFAFVQVNVAQVVGFHDVDLLVLTFAHVRINHHGAIVTGVHQVGIVSILLHRADHAFKLPGGGGAAGIEEMPGDVDLQRRIGILRNHILVASQIHQPMIVGQDGGGRSR